MGSKEAVIAFWLLLLGLSHGIEVNLTSTFKAEFGWQMKCVWSVSKKLQSVRLYKDEAQFLVFRPYYQGENITFNFIPPPYDTRITVKCYDTGRTGSCYIGLELLRAPMFDSKYKCEASDEDPKDMHAAEYFQEMFVPPSYPQLEVLSVEGLTAVVSCMATGIPTPRLTWRIGEQKIPENSYNNHTSIIWDFQTKLWHSRSVVSVLRNESKVLFCTATVTKSGKRPEELTSELYLKSIGNNGRSFIGLSHGIEVNLTSTFKAEFGWQMKCVWSVIEKLQSVRLYKDEAQFLVFRPEKQGPNITFNFIPPPYDTRITVNCYDTGRTGSCYIGLELLRAPMFDSKYKCEASDEDPRFDTHAAEYFQEMFVPPSQPQLEVLSEEGLTTVVNCTATGMFVPRLTWRIGEQKIPENSYNNRTRIIWDFKTKLWHTKSVVSVLRDESKVLSCTATVPKSGGRSEEQTSEIHLKSIGNNGRSLIGGKLCLSIFTLVTLLR